MTLDVLLAPDVFVNASVALGSPPDQVVQRVLGQHPKECAVTKWILARIEAMLLAVPTFKDEAVEPQLRRIVELTRPVATDGEHGPDDWAGALVEAAKAAGVERVVTDHPDLLEQERVDGIEFVSTEAWLLEQALPPPPPAS